ncbi:MAG: ankyrin repeat domain-containing protein [Dysgonamonadaceae bacterium]|jgi:ankyrin repeat protein|nr:ankyrin repeat domain-containing protein [Dysgonamonadaceae bacterium]
MSTSITKGNEFAAQGKMKELDNWLHEGNNPNAYDAEGWTPLLKASVRGQSEAVKLLLENSVSPADISLPHAVSKALPIHFAGHSGDIATAKILLEHQPEHLNAVWDLNGHTCLLQAVFYAHAPLTKFLVERGADTSLTTARGLGPMEMAKQFQNQTLIDILAAYDSPPAVKAENYRKYLQRIAPVIDEDELEIQKRSDELIELITSELSAAFTSSSPVEESIGRIRRFADDKKVDVNRLGGVLQQPPLVVTVTGNNGFPTNTKVQELRNSLAAFLLERGADPTLHEVHPMGAHTIIRACVFNHLDILKNCAACISKEQLRDALNEIPVVNGLTALHDTVLRAGTADDLHFEKYLEQTQWCMDCGARSDIEDFSGRTQLSIAEGIAHTERRKRLLKILQINN